MDTGTIAYVIYALCQAFVVTCWLYGGNNDSTSSILVMGIMVVLAPFVTVYVAWILLSDAIDYCSIKKDDK